MHALRLPVLAAFALTAACAGTARNDITVGGTRFAVVTSGPGAVAHRLSPEFRPDRRETVLKGLLAIESATGCRIRRGRWSGDTSVIRAELDCAAPRRPALGLSCTVTSEWPIPALGTSVEEFDCDARAD